jgi:hypothetical protein
MPDARLDHYTLGMRRLAETTDFFVRVPHDRLADILQRNHHPQRDHETNVQFLVSTFEE